jgi:hypothetical protein
MRRYGRPVLLGAALAAALVPLPSSLVERWYSSIVYPAIQRVLTPISNLVPFALFDVIWVSATAAAAVVVYRRIARDGWARGSARALLALATAAAVVYLVFLAAWGLNYRRIPLARKVAFEPDRVNRQAAADLGELNAATLNHLYAATHPGHFSLPSLAESFQRAIAALGARRPIVPGRPKQTLLGGYFHQISVSGMTDPFLLETLVASDLLDIERPFVIAHEWAHLAGYADESEANYVAWLTCRHGDAFTQYSGALAVLGYAVPARPLRQALDPGPRLDLWAIQRRYATTSPVLRAAAREGYDKYLKANRVEQGVESYDLVVQLILGTELDAAGYPRLR